MKCVYCNKAFTCGCQKTQAPDGQTVHKTCLSDYTKHGGMTLSSNSLTANIKLAKKNLNR